mmetsp:Transcript_11046/g.16570  ORF Transcript_11046/g.16570 Transcript_11046/m.16570 type:complete len:225 (-) Transcript_11046:37-711(-)
MHGLVALGSQQQAEKVNEIITLFGKCIANQQTPCFQTSIYAVHGLGLMASDFSTEQASRVLKMFHDASTLHNKRDVVSQIAQSTGMVVGAMVQKIDENQTIDTIIVKNTLKMLASLMIPHKQRSSAGRKQAKKEDQIQVHAALSLVQAMYALDNTTWQQASTLVTDAIVDVLLYGLKKHQNRYVNGYCVEALKYCSSNKRAIRALIDHLALLRHCPKTSSRSQF